MSDDARRRPRAETQSGLPLADVYRPEDLGSDWRYEDRLGDPGQLPVHARPARQHVPRQALDDAHVLGLRHARGHQPPLPAPARAWADGAVDGVRHADADGLRPRRPALARRGGARRGVGRVGGRHRAAVRRHPARQGDDVDDDQRAGGRPAGVLRGRRRAPGHPARGAGRHDPERHAEGVHRPEGVDLRHPAASAHHPRHAGLLHARDAALEHDQRQRLPHPRGGSDRGAGAGVDAGRRHRLRRARSRRRPRRRRLRPRLSFFLDVHNDFFEEVAKFRAARRMWARIMRDRFGAKNPRAWLLRAHAQTAGVSLVAQQPLNNVVRTTLQALAAVLGGTQSLHTNSFDETYALPTEAAATLALRTQQVIAEETGVAGGGGSARRQLLRRAPHRPHGGRGQPAHRHDRRDGRHRRARSRRAGRSARSPRRPTGISARSTPASAPSSASTGTSARKRLSRSRP